MALYEYADRMRDYDVVGIDEGQFVCGSKALFGETRCQADLVFHGDVGGVGVCGFALMCLFGQFPDLVSFSEEMANKGKTVIIAALDGTYQRKPFGHVLELIPLAESVIKLSAVCMGCCKRDAAFSHRISSEKQVEVIGGADKYVALCRACHLHFTFVLHRVFVAAVYLL